MVFCTILLFDISLKKVRGSRFEVTVLRVAGCGFFDLRYGDNQ